jgi:hypothetical protein
MHARCAPMMHVSAGLDLSQAEPGAHSRPNGSSPAFAQLPAGHSTNAAWSTSGMPRSTRPRGRSAPLDSPGPPAQALPRLSHCESDARGFFSSSRAYRRWQRPALPLGEGRA